MKIKRLIYFSSSLSKVIQKLKFVILKKNIININIVNLNFIMNIYDNLKITSILLNLKLIYLFFDINENVRYF